MLAWHFLPHNKRLGYGDNRVVQAGKTYRLKSGIPTLCRNGMHGSRRLIDAIHYAPGDIVCRVDITGDIRTSSDKIVGRNRKVLWMLDVANVLHEFACRCAEDVFSLVDKKDPYSLAAVKAKRDWMAGKITDCELDEEYSMALDVAFNAARSAAMRDASVAASQAAHYAVVSAGQHASARYKRDTPYTCRSSQEMSTAILAAGKVMETKQNRRLVAMVMALTRFRKKHRKWMLFLRAI